MAWLHDVLRDAPNLIEAITPVILVPLTFKQASKDVLIDKQVGLGTAEDMTRQFQVLSAALTDSTVLQWGSFRNGVVGFNMDDYISVRIAYHVDGEEALKDLSEMVGTDSELISHALATGAWSFSPRPTKVAPYSQRIYQPDPNHNIWILSLIFKVTLIIGC